MKHWFAAAYLFALAFLSALGSAAPAATLVVENSVLRGATGVLVGGRLYDVEFLDGTCSGAFNGCTQSSFTFSSLVTASAAASALLDQVFVNGPLGAFDDSPELTYGCAASCATFIPFLDIRDGTAFASYAGNEAENSLDLVGNILIDRTFDFEMFGNFARFTLTATTAVPEPATWATMLLGFGILGAAVRRSRRQPMAAFAIG